MSPNWFVAIPVRAGDWFHDRVQDPPERVRIFHPEDLHLTIAFLGSVGEEAARRAMDTAEDPLPRRVDATLGAVRALPSKRRTSALSAELAGGRDAVAGMIEALRPGMLAEAGARPDNRPPLPHITIARPRRRATRHERLRAAAWGRSLDLHGVAVSLDELALYTWSEDRRERLFQIVATRPLSP